MCYDGGAGEDTRSSSLPRVLGRLHWSPSSELSFEKAEAGKERQRVSVRWEEQEREKGHMFRGSK